eukprot:1324918-Amorphochlora_amoeboformis.AAC.1
MALRRTRKALITWHAERQDILGSADSSILPVADRHVYGQFSLHVSHRVTPHTGTPAGHNDRYTCLST